MPGTATLAGPATPATSTGAMAPSGGFRPQPDNVGILAGEVYFPSTYVSAGAGAQGLGQRGSALLAPP